MSTTKGEMKMDEFRQSDELVTEREAYEAEQQMT